MGYHVNLVPNFPNADIEEAVFKCFIDNGEKLIPHGFSMFLSRTHEKSELSQIEKLLNIDLSIYTKLLESYEFNKEDWSTVIELKTVTQLFINKLNETPDFGSKIKIEDDWNFEWGNYFNIRHGKEVGEETILDGLQFILAELNYYDKCGVEYAAFHGE